MKRYCLFWICFLFFLNRFAAQTEEGLVAYYPFSNGSIIDELSNHHAKAPGTSYVSDRFGNPRSACYLNGSEYSYINLGTSAKLKPRQGTISVWIRQRYDVWAGAGYNCNPIILTKSHDGDDFFEGYSIGLHLPTSAADVCCSQKSQIQCAVTYPVPLSELEWYHLVMTYDDNHVAMYVNGEHIGRVRKSFPTTFLASDSVMLGYSANEKNKRFFCGSLDDLRIYNRVLSADEVKELYLEPDPIAWHSVLRWSVIFVLAGILVWVAGFLFVRRQRKLVQQEKEKNILQQKIFEMETKAVKAQMNPHFIFNSMNAIQQLILENENEKANAYLVRFSRLLRSILESNNDVMIPLESEVEILNLYLEIESMRFGNNFHADVSVEQSLTGSGYRIPQMFIQPFVENAIWHGLLPKQGEKLLKVKFRKLNDQTLECTVDDNGIGREASAAKEPSKSKHRSLGIGFSMQRMELLRREWNGDYHILITDKKDEAGNSLGTIVVILLPLLVKNLK